MFQQVRVLRILYSIRKLQVIFVQQISLCDLILFFVDIYKLCVGAILV